MGQLLFVTSRWLAIAGGLVLMAASLATIYSIISLQVLNSSFPRDVELVSYALVVSVFLFMPYGQMVKGHVIVDFFTMKASRRTRAVLDALSSILFAGLAALIAWRMTVGGIEMFERGQNTAVLKIPFWWSFPIAVLCLDCWRQSVPTPPGEA